ncbi:MAG: hypothetical protein ACYC1C_12065 [Chloroflexota bacterium]
MRRRLTEDYVEDWRDTRCSVCHRPVSGQDWQDDEEYGVLCPECYARLVMLDDNPETE